MKFFWKDLPMNADIERHRKEETELRQKIEELEALPERDKMQERSLTAYRHFLSQLLESKAEVTSKIGKKK